MDQQNDLKSAASAERPNIRIVTVPATEAPDVIEDALNEPYDDSYFLVSLLSEHNGYIRAVFKAYRQTEAERAALDKDKAARLEEREKQRDTAAAAIAIVKANPRDSTMRLVVRLGEAGIKRGASWVNLQRRYLTVADAVARQRPQVARDGPQSL